MEGAGSNLMSWNQVWSSSVFHPNRQQLEWEREEQNDASLPFPPALFHTRVGTARAEPENQGPHVSQLGSILW